MLGHNPPGLLREVLEDVGGGASVGRRARLQKLASSQHEYVRTVFFVLLDGLHTTGSSGGKNDLRSKHLEGIGERQTARD